MAPIEEISVVNVWPRLSHLVETLRVLTPIDGCAQPVNRLPDGTASLLVRVTAGGARSIGRAGDISIAGPRTHALFKLAPPVRYAVHVQWKPGAARSIFDIPLHALTDRVVLLEHTWGSAGAQLRDTLLAAPDMPALLAVLEEALIARVRAANDSVSARLARRALRLLEDSRSPVRVDRVAAYLGVTTRHLRRVFVEHVGVAPKEFARILRLQRVLRARGEWAEVALAAGYYDQAHMIAEFNQLVGMTPGAFAKQVGVRSAALGAQYGCGDLGACRRQRQDARAHVQLGLKGIGRTRAIG